MSASLQIQHKTFRGNHRPASLALIICLAVYLLLFCSLLAADEPDADETASSPWKVKDWKVQTSLYTLHYDSDPDHVNNQKLIGLEAVCENNWLFGAAFFDNSFGQNTQFVYFGKSWQLFGSNYWYLKLVGGLLHGYKDPYEDKIPLNGLGVAPAILPSLGFRYKRVLLEANFAGTAALTITGGIVF